MSRVAQKNYKQISIVLFRFTFDRIILGNGTHNKAKNTFRGGVHTGKVIKEY